MGLSLAAGVLSPASCFSAVKGDGAPLLLSGAGRRCPWAPGAPPWVGPWQMLHPRPLVSVVPLQETWTFWLGRCVCWDSGGASWLRCPRCLLQLLHAWWCCLHLLCSEPLLAKHDPLPAFSVGTVSGEITRDRGLLCSFESSASTSGLFSVITF